MSSTTLARSLPTNLTALAIGASLPTIGWMISAVRWHQRQADARKDGLTGALRRPAFTAAAQQFVDQFKNNAVVCFVDVDAFKKVNDTYGHAAGDAVLVALASRMKTWAGAHGVVGRLDGDEFVAVARLHPSGRDLRLKHLSELLAQPVTFDGRTLDVSASIGVAEPATLRTCDLSVLLRSADAAMYEAKEAGQHAGLLRYAERKHAETPSRNGRRLGRPGTALEVAVAA